MTLHHDELGQVNFFYLFILICELDWINLSLIDHMCPYYRDLYVDIGMMQETLLCLIITTYMIRQRSFCQVPQFGAHLIQRVTLNCFNYKAICPFHFGITGMKDMVEISVGRPVAYLELQY